MILIMGPPKSLFLASVNKKREDLSTIGPLLS